MKLFLIIYAGANIGGVAGPLPYDMNECERRRDEFRAAQYSVLWNGFSKEENRYLTVQEMKDLKQMRFECEFREVRPEMGDAE